MPKIKLEHNKFLPWLIWLCGCSFLLYQFLLQTSVSVMITDLEKDLQISPAQVGLLSSSFFYPYLLLQVPAGLLVDRFGARRTLTIGLLATALAVFSFAHIHTLVAATFCRMAMGLMAATAVSAALYLSIHWFPIERFALIAGLTETVGMMGGLFGQIYLSRRVVIFGWRQALLEYFAIGILFAILVGIFVRDKPKHKLNIPLQIDNFSAIGQHLRKVMSIPQIWFNGLFSGLTFAIMSAFAALWCIPYLQVRYQIPSTIAAYGSASMFMGAALGSPFWGWLSDRLGKRKSPMFLGIMLTLFFLISAIYLNLSFIATVSLLFATGFCATVYMLPFAVNRDISSPETQGTTMSFTNMMSIAIGAPLLQPFIGFILELNPAKKIQDMTVYSLHDYQRALVMLPICLLLALLLLSFIKETNCKAFLQ